MGIFVLLGFIVGTFFFQAPAFQMAVTVGGLLLFALFVLYDTSRIMLHLDASEWVAGALSLFVDFINLFVRILSLLSDRR
ncbi:MAG: Bax inhibitor-1 family protein [Candidatus Sumerlaeaceae bacterium]|nr:Bax inhibitor-1 family protein [Candidatus Sumerlaeaceae bacterium]